MGGQADSHRVSLLSILVNEQVLSEDQLLDIQLEEHGLGLIDLSDIDSLLNLREDLDLKACWATLTVSIDLMEDTVYLATSYYLSRPYEPIGKTRSRRTSFGMLPPLIQSPDS